ncbi:hypothetical protein DL96DRAFT_1640866 [Flagelloscypha sp. PMI_526]|nr:hypothetical protein DL96DRAFT_1640866 [Flagelloscypha sp. PMI_526]
MSVRVWNSVTGESEVTSTTIILPDQTVVEYQPSGYFLILPQIPNTTPHTMLSVTIDHRWLLISSKQSRYWIPPSYSQFDRSWFFDNLAVLTYTTGKLIIFAVDK